MKKIVLSLFLVAIATSNINAQEKPYNKWSLDFNGGLTKPAKPMTPGYYSETFESFYHVDAGVRYMFNNKFGLKVDFGYDDMKNGKNSLDFKTKYYRTNIQGVANLGRIMNFEDWTRVFNLQAHAGFGYSWMTNDYFKDTDEMGNVMAGLTGQIKLGKRVALNADFTMIKNIEQDWTFDGRTDGVKKLRTFEGTLYNATLGLSFYLGGAKEHADWYVSNPAAVNLDEIHNELEEIQTKLTDVDDKMKDSDNDGTPDYLDKCINVPGAVDNHGCPWPDKDKDGVPDHLDECPELAGPRSNNGCPQMEKKDIDVLNGYAKTILFNTNQSTFQTQSYVVLDGIIKKMKEFPNSKFYIKGYTDSTGSTSINLPLSDARANAVKDYLVKNGIKSDRLVAKGYGSADPIDTNKTAQGRANNRRTEIILIK